MSTAEITTTADARNLVEHVDAILRNYPRSNYVRLTRAEAQTLVEAIPTGTVAPAPTAQTLAWFPFVDLGFQVVAFEARRGSGEGFWMTEHYADGTSHTIESFATPGSAVMAAADRAGWRA